MQKWALWHRLHKHDGLHKHDNRPASYIVVRGRGAPLFRLYKQGQDYASRNVEQDSHLLRTATCPMQAAGFPDASALVGLHVVQ